MRQIAEQKPSCLGMVRTFCQNLYRPENQGKMVLPLAPETLEIRKGKTANDFSQAYYEFALSEIHNREQLPKGFRERLVQRNYFRKLREYLSRKPARKMTLEDRIEILRLADEIDSIWSSAIQETVLKRMEKKYPGYSSLPEDLVPLELKHEANRIRAILISEIATAVWTDHPNWKKVEKQFEEVRRTFHDVIQRHLDLPKDVKRDWLKRLASVRLVLPGSDPEVDMYSCTKTEDNAYYYTHKNYLTVCAGDFNAEDIRQTLAHELAHSLDLDRSMTIHENESKLGVAIAALRKDSCTPKTYNCLDWQKFKENYVTNYADFDRFSLQVPELHACLKNRSTKSPIPEEYLQRVAREEVQDTVSVLAEQNTFLRIITPELPMPDGSFQKNPMYLNPCGYYLWDHQSHPFDEELSLLLFFTSEYRCSPELPNDVRFKHAIEEATELQKTLVYSRVRREGEFSTRWRLNADGYAASPVERFADALASEVFADILHKIKSVEKRRALYLANVAWLCPRPSLQQMLPHEARIQTQFYNDAHSDDFQRQKELLPEVIRDAIVCQKDFDTAECPIPHLPDPPPPPPTPATPASAPAALPPGSSAPVLAVPLAPVPEATSTLTLPLASPSVPLTPVPSATPSLAPASSH